MGALGRSRPPRSRVSCQTPGRARAHACSLVSARPHPQQSTLAAPASHAAHGPWPRTPSCRQRTPKKPVAGRRSQRRRAQGAGCNAATLQPAEAVGCCSRYTPRAQSSRLDRWTLDLLLPAGLWAVGPNAQASGNCTLCPVPCALYPVPCPSSLNASGLLEHALMRCRIGAVGIQSPPPEPPDERLIWPFIAR